MSSWSDIVSAVRSVATHVAVGGDLTHVSLPAVFCFPYSTVMMLAQKRMRGSELLPAIPDCKTELGRMLLVAEWVLSGCTVDEVFGKKPLNPILGETFLCKCGDIVYFSEQVSHHPPISAFHFEHTTKDITFDGTANVNATFWGNSVAVEVKGASILRIDISGRVPDKLHLKEILKSDENSLKPSQETPEHEEYIFDPALPKGHAKGLLIGSKRYEFGGNTSFVCGKSGLRCDMEFKTSKMFSSDQDIVSGEIYIDKTKEILVKFSGKWSGVVKAKGITSESKKILKMLKPDRILHDFAKIQNLHPIRAFTTEETKIRSSNIVWEEVLKFIQDGNFHDAEREKIKVENTQREYIKRLTYGEIEHNHLFFTDDPQRAELEYELKSSNDYSNGVLYL